MKRLLDLYPTTRAERATPPARHRLARSAAPARAALRVQIAALCDWAQAAGHRQHDLAARLGLAPRTLRAWQQLAGADAACLGRPVLRSPVAERNAVIALLDECGPRLGVPTLADCFPHLPRTS